MLLNESKRNKVEVVDDYRGLKLFRTLSKKCVEEDRGIARMFRDKVSDTAPIHDGSMRELALK